ncbi:hypothetical protein [Sphingomonas sp. GC_Shp_3]|uniref:hypothetical protein n=1 Tax=Sphingomonas sp. GC_Shp_3 TaxID=2937383 RepID=UPI00226A5572|nr:hypothetical protein [Sphingomonas sp. GC_Shp_3]
MSALIDHRRDLELISPRCGAAPHNRTGDRKPNSLRGGVECVFIHKSAGAAK